MAAILSLFLARFKPPSSHFSPSTEKPPDKIKESTKVPASLSSTMIEQLQHQSPDKIKGVLILTQPRSGSTLLGEIIKLYAQIFYLFEPREKNWTAKRHQFISCDKMMPFFNCKFLYNDFEAVKASFWASQKTSLIQIDPSKELLSRSKFAKTQDYVYEICKQRIVAIKSIGNCTTFPASLMHEQNYYRIIHLIRDPRAVMNSRLEIAWTNTTTIRRHSKEMCDKILQKASLPIPKLTVLYEELVKNPLELSTKIHQYIGWTGTEQQSITKKYINKHMSIAKSNANPFSTFKNASAVVDAWTHKLSPALQKIVESECEEVLRVYYKYIKLE